MLSGLQPRAVNALEECPALAPADYRSADCCKAVPVWQAAAGFQGGMRAHCCGGLVMSLWLDGYSMELQHGMDGCMATACMAWHSHC